MTNATSESLYRRLVGYGAVTSVIGGFYEHTFAKPETAVFFRSHRRQSCQPIVQNAVDVFVPSRADLRPIRARTW